MPAFGFPTAFFINGSFSQGLTDILMRRLFIPRKPPSIIQTELYFLYEVKAVGRTLSVIDISIGIILAIVLLMLRKPLLSMYNLTEEATILADHLMIVMSVVMVGMSYQMPVSVGVIQGGGDTKFQMYMNLISTWGIVMPLSFLAAFVWKLPVEWVVVAVQSDQLFKCVPVFLRFRSYKWIRKLT